MKTAVSPKTAPALPDSAHLDNLLDSLLILVEQEANLLREGMASEVRGIQDSIAILTSTIVPLVEQIKAHASLSPSSRSKLDRIKALQESSTSSASAHLIRIGSRLRQITHSQSRLNTLRPVYGNAAGKRASASYRSVDLKG